MEKYFYFGSSDKGHMKMVAENFDNGLYATRNYCIYLKALVYNFTPLSRKDLDADEAYFLSRVYDFSYEGYYLSKVYDFNNELIKSHDIYKTEEIWVKIWEHYYRLKERTENLDFIEKSFQKLIENIDKLFFDLFLDFKGVERCFNLGIEKFQREDAESSFKSNIKYAKHLGVNWERFISEKVEILDSFKFEIYKAAEKYSSPCTFALLESKKPNIKNISNENKLWEEIGFTDFWNSDKDPRYPYKNPIIGIIQERAKTVIKNIVYGNYFLSHAERKKLQLTDFCCH